MGQRLWAQYCHHAGCWGSSQAWAQQAVHCVPATPDWHQGGQSSQAEVSGRWGKTCFVVALSCLPAMWCLQAHTGLCIWDPRISYLIYIYQENDLCCQQLMPARGSACIHAMTMSNILVWPGFTVAGGCVAKVHDSGGWRDLPEVCRCVHWWVEAARERYKAHGAVYGHTRKVWQQCDSKDLAEMCHDFYASHHICHKTLKSDIVKL